MHELLIRGAQVVDGLGNEPRKADIRVANGLIAEIGDIRAKNVPADAVIDADGLVLAPGIIDLHTHYDAQVTWDPTLSPSPSLGVTTAVMGNCGFGIAPSSPETRGLIMKNLSVVEGMDLDALRAGINWRFESFGQYMQALRRHPPYLNVGMLAGHSVIRTAVMGEAASLRKQATAEEMARMSAMVADAMASGAIGLGSSYSLNHSGFGGVPMPSTITEFEELDALVAAMGTDRPGIVQLASGPLEVQALEPLAARYGRAVFKSTGVAMYNDQAPERAIGVFEACREARERGNGIYVQIPCQPLSFDFTMANAYPFFSHDAFADIKAYSPEQLKPVFADHSFRDRFRKSLAQPRPGMIFQGNWDRVVVAVTATEAYAGLCNKTIAQIAVEQSRDPLDVILDISLDEALQTTFVGKFLNVGDEGVARLLKHQSGVIALSDAGAHLIYMCDAGFGLHFLAKWVRQTGVFDLAEGVRRLTSHPADLYGIANRGRIQVGAHADMILFDFDTVGVSEPERLADLPAGGRRTIRRPTGLHGVFVNGVCVFDGSNYLKHRQGPGHVLDRFNASSGIPNGANI